MLEPEDTSGLTSDEGSLRVIDLEQQQHGDISEDQHQDRVQDDREVLLVEGLQDFQGVVEESGGAQQFQQYQPLVIHNLAGTLAGMQGFVTSAGEVVHVVQPSDGSVHPAAPNRNVNANSQPMYHQQVMHPDLYRLIKMFPDFSAKTLHRIFVMCHCDLKRALDQALFARQFRQLDSQQSFPVPAMTRSHYHHAPYRVPARQARPPYMQAGLDEMCLPRGPGLPGQPGPGHPGAAGTVLLYHQDAAKGLQQDAEVMLIPGLSDSELDAHLLQAKTSGEAENLLEVHRKSSSEDSPLLTPDASVSDTIIRDSGESTGDVATAHHPTMVC